MQGIFEGIFHVVYLGTVLSLGIIMASKSKGRPYFRLMGFMAITLGFGDAFHLIPRIVALNGAGLESYAAALGFGKLVTSITMTIFYLILYAAWKLRFGVSRAPLTDAAMGILAALRIALCLFPQNQWFVYAQPLSWAIYRNLPFAIIGLLTIALFYREGRARRDAAAKRIALAVALSFAFYAPVVLWAQASELVGMLMIPKTLAYLWVVFIAYGEFRKDGGPAIRA